MSATIVVTVAVAFDGSTFTDISSRVTRTSIRYGRDRLLDEFNSGSCIITYDNANNSLTPGHSDSTYGNTELKTTTPAAPILPTSITKNTIEIFYSLMSHKKLFHIIMPSMVTS